MKLIEQLTIQTLLKAYQEGRIDALEVSEPTRYSAKPWAGKSPIPAGHCGCTKHEEKIWDDIRKHYLSGYKSQSIKLIKK